MAGFHLPYCKIPGIRPTLESVRKSFFDTVAQVIPGNGFIDAFAGSGIMGIEALSRGAEPVVFFESAEQTCRQLKQSLLLTGLMERTILIRGDVSEKIEESLAGLEQTIVFCDPPYKSNLMQGILNRLSGSASNKKILLIAIEHHHKNRPMSGVTGWIVTKEKRYGETQLTFIVPQGTIKLEVHQ
ncbi:16S rRNA (guanine(966)-N(2))-methyltransferase RsmD [bacterium]|nr:16S rRNA (guanine(966)-N(2))-methyltransferase RsmD [candidate division CSSED10-310 bacterium]